SSKLLAAAVLTHLDPEDREYFTSLDATKAVRMLESQPYSDGAGGNELFHTESGQLRQERLSDEVQDTLRQAATLAGSLGHSSILAPHIFLALLRRRKGLAETLVRQQCPPQVRSDQLPERLMETLRLRGGARPSPALRLASFGPDAVRVLD